MSDKPNGMKTVYAITERGEKSFWTRCGAAFTNRDGSITIQLDCMPVSGRLQIRDDDRDDRDDRGDRSERRERR